MDKAEKISPEERTILEVRLELSKISSQIFSQCEGKTANEIKKIINDTIDSILGNLLKSKYKQYTWVAARDITVNIEYVNEKKKQTTRKIKIEQIKSSEQNSCFLIEAYCYLRKTHRSFKTKNIQTMYYENGEVITVEDLIKQMVKVY